MADGHYRKPLKYSLLVSFPPVSAGFSGDLSVSYFVEKFNAERDTRSMTELELRILQNLSSGNFEISWHATQRQRERVVHKRDIMRAAQDYLDVYTQENGNVAVIGPDFDGDELKVVAAYDGVTTVVSVM